MTTIQMSQVIKNICDLLVRGDIQAASDILKQSYSFQNLSKPAYALTDVQFMHVLIRNGFTDRYSGQQLIFTPVLRILSGLMPIEFPFHPHWKMSECHIAYWELAPTIDHVVPLARGGTHDEHNLVSTSMVRNAAKSNWTLEELGWSLVPPGDIKEWDGLTGWLLRYIDDHPGMQNEKYLRRWHRAAIDSLKNIVLR